MNIIDNFLLPEDFNLIQNLMMGSEFPWYWNSFINYDTDGIDEYQFTHNFYERARNGINSDFMPLLSSCIHKLKIQSLIKIKANLNVSTKESKILGGYHIDINDCTTSILYINTNNGCTIFEDGNRVECIANRMVIFDSNTKHTGMTCTDEKNKVLINFNYYGTVSSPPRESQ